MEQDPQELWATQWAVVQQALHQAQVRPGEVAAVGLTNQRETTVLWSRRTGQPVHAALVWQDRRTEPLCAALRAEGLSEIVAQRTGLVIDPYFSATKLRWLLDHVPGSQAAAERSELAFGTVDSWLLWNLTGGAVHATDISNASRTMLWNLQRQEWDEALLQRLNIPRALLPAVQASCGWFGEASLDPIKGVPITGIAGDQQAMSADLQAQGLPALRELRVDGGACVNDTLMQLQADLLGLPVVRPSITETTALGAAYLAGLGVGLWRSVEDIQHLWREDRRFEPRWSEDRRGSRLHEWEQAVRRVRGTPAHP